MGFTPLLIILWIFRGKKAKPSRGNNSKPHNSAFTRPNTWKGNVLNSTIHTKNSGIIEIMQRKKKRNTWNNLCKTTCKNQAKNQSVGATTNVSYMCVTVKKTYPRLIIDFVFPFFIVKLPQNKGQMTNWWLPAPQ